MIYLDYTTANYSHESVCADIWVRYTISRENYGVAIDWKCNHNYEIIKQYSTYKIWEKKGIARSTEKLELYIILTNQNNHPYLHWNSYHDPNIIGYYLYREVITKNNSVLDKLPINATSYLDTEILLGSSSSAVAKYWVKARINSTTESLVGNSVSTSGEFQPQKISTNNKRDKELPKFRLSANFPNPFNPSTIITYELPKREYVTLKVYNSLGKEVAVLVEGQKEAGNYSITFNAKSAIGGLPSGIYLYKLTAGNFTKVRKMILMK